MRRNFTRPAFGIEGEHVAERRAAVDLGGVVAGVALDEVGAVAVVPDERVVAGSAVHRVAALRADEAVVAVAAVERVAGVGAGQHVVAGAAVERRGDDLGVLRQNRHRVVAVPPVDDDDERAVGRDRLVAGGRRCPSPTPLLSPPVVWPCTSRPPDTDTVSLSSAPSRFSVAVVPTDRRRARRRVRGTGRHCRVRPALLRAWPGSMYVSCLSLRTSSHDGAHRSLLGARSARVTKDRARRVGRHR